MKDIPETCRPY